MSTNADDVYRAAGQYLLQTLKDNQDQLKKSLAELTKVSGANLLETTHELRDTVLQDFNRIASSSLLSTSEMLNDMSETVLRDLSGNLLIREDTRRRLLEMSRATSDSLAQSNLEMMQRLSRSILHNFPGLSIAYSHGSDDAGADEAVEAYEANLAYSLSVLNDMMGEDFNELKKFIKLSLPNREVFGSFVNLFFQWSNQLFMVLGTDVDMLFPVYSSSILLALLMAYTFSRLKD